MFVAWRDLRFAKGRFALMGTVVVLITVLVGLLSGLTAGLGRQNISAITGLPADHLAFSAPADGQQLSFTDSSVSERQWRSWADTAGVERAEPLGITMTRAKAGADASTAESSGGGGGARTASVAAFGVRPGSGLSPHADRVGDGEVVVTHAAAEELGLRSGQRLTVAGDVYTVAAVAGDASFSHAPVVWTSLGDWQQLAPQPADGGSGGAGGEESGRRATVIALSVTGETELAAVDERLGTHTVTREDSLSAIGSYTAENGSLQLMRGFLFAISALVIGAFFTVWTIQRSRDIAVLKALGASTAYLLRDALGQAVVLLLGGTLVGTAVAAAAGGALAGTVPFVLEPVTLLLPAAVMIVLGAVGAALSVRRVTTVDPLTALGGG